MKAVYLSGPMTGLPGYNYPAFRRYAERWRESGDWHVFNPAEHFDGRTDLPREAYLRKDIEALMAADAIAMLPGWQNSHGATLELAIARAIGLDVLDADTGGPLAPESVCAEADRIVSGDRGAAYGHPFDDYTRTGALWGPILHGWAREAAASPVPIPVPPDLAILCMVQVKVSREVHQPKRDNRVDMNGYAKCLDMVRERQGRAA